MFTRLALPLLILLPLFPQIYCPVEVTSLLEVRKLNIVPATAIKRAIVVESIDPKSVAAKAGIQIGDQLLSYDGKPLLTTATLLAWQQNTFGKSEVELQIVRDGQQMKVIVPIGSLGIRTRPDLDSAVLRLYDEGRAAEKARNTNEAIVRWSDAAGEAQVTGDNIGAAWLYGRVATIHEAARNWQKARAAHAAAWNLIKDGQHVDPPGQSMVLSALARCNQSLNDYSESSRLYEQALQIDDAAGLSFWAASNLNRLGIIATLRGDLNAGHDYHTRALTIRERLAPDSLDVAASLNNLGTVARSRGDLETAHNYYTRALAIKERLEPNSLSYALTLDNLGIVARNRGNLTAADDYFSHALTIRERLAPNSLDVAASLNNLGILARNRGDLKPSHDYLTRALAIKERLAPESLDVAGTLGNLGLVAQNRGDLDAAQDYHTRALAIQNRLAPESLNVAANLNNLGVIALERGDLEAAHDYISRSLAIKERLAPESLDVASSINNLGSVAWHRGQLTQAHDYYSRALTIQQRLAPNSLIVAGSLSNLGLVELDRGNIDEARDYYNRALEIRSRLAPNSLDLSHSLNNIGKADMLRGDLSAAHDSFIRALAIRKRLAPDSLDMAESVHSLGLVALQQSRAPEALPLFASAVELLEAHRGRIHSAEVRALLVERYTSKYSGLLRCYLALQDNRSALTTLERSRARSLVEMLSERSVDFSQDAPVESLREEQSLYEARIAAYHRLAKLDPNKDAAQIEELHSEIQKVGVAQRQLTSQIRRASPKYASLRYPEPFNSHQVREALDPGTLLLSYYVDDEQTYLFGVTRNELNVYQITLSKTDLTTQVEEFRRAVSEPRGRVELRGRELYDLLVRPAQMQVKQADRLLICPDGILHKLPFAALVSSTPPQLRYLGEEKPLHTTVSMTVYAEIRKDPQNTQGSGSEMLLALGDPEYLDKSSVPDPDVPARIGTRLKMTPLPHSRIEVQDIGKLYGDRAEVHLGKDASVNTLRQKGGKATILHLSCHGLLNDIDPLASALALSAEGVNNDGMLHAYEILEKLRLNADLVTLSACETGLGQATKHEGLIGMTRALHYAGARSVLVSLWKVADESTAALMKAFYTELKRGASKDRALQKAMSALRKHPDWHHPYYWAPFVLSGDWRQTTSHAQPGIPRQGKNACR